MQKTKKFDSSQICFESDEMQILSIVSKTENAIDFPLKQVPVNFSILRSDSKFSNRWGVKTSTKGDVYIYCRDIPNTEKVSLHASGCQHISFTNETAKRLGMDSRFGPVWNEPKFNQQATATFCFLFPPWGVGIPFECTNLKKDELLIVGHKEKVVVVAFFIVNSMVRMKTSLPHFVIGKIPLNSRKTLHIVSWKERQTNLREQVERVFPHVSHTFLKSEAKTDDFTLNVQGFRTPNSAFMVSVPVRYTPSVTTPS